MENASRIEGWGMNDNEEWSAELKPEKENGHFVFERWNLNDATDRRSD